MVTSDEYNVRCYCSAYHKSSRITENDIPISTKSLLGNNIMTRASRYGMSTIMILNRYKINTNVETIMNCPLQ